MIIYEIYDVKAKNPAAVFIRSRDEDAIRSFENLLCDPADTVFSINPEDFELIALDPHAEELCDRLRVVKEGSSYTKAVLQYLRLDRVKSDDELFHAIGEAYIKYKESTKDE